MMAPQEHPLVGKTVARVTLMDVKTLQASGWEDEECTMIQFDDSTTLFAMRDPEGNGPGTLIHTDEAGIEFYVRPE